MEEHRYDTESIKSRVNIVDLVAEVVTIKRQGKDWFGQCPFHADKDPSFSVSEAKQMFCCFGCGAAGDLFDFYTRFHQVSFPQAVQRIAERYHIDPASAATPARVTHRRPSAPSSWSPDMRELPPPAWCEHAAKFVSWCYEQLYNEPEALAYVRGRGFTDATIAAFGLGWNPGKGGKDVFRTRESWGLSTEKNADTGKARRLWLPVGMVIPWFSGSGLVVRLRIRRPDPLTFGPRYYFVPGGCSATFWKPPAPTVQGCGLPRPPVYVVVESELDGVLLHQEAADLCGVVAPGSASAKPDAYATLALRGAVCILNALDNDQAGAEARPWWAEHFPQAKRWPTPAGKDPGEALQQGVNLREWITAGLPEGLRP